MKRTKATKVVLSLCLVAVLAIGGTWAYLSSITDKVTNVFTFQSNISAELDEPTWDEENAKNLTPGAEVPKDPQITNTSDIEEYVAIKLTFQKGNGTTMSEEEMTRFLSLVTIKHGPDADSLEDGINTTDWTLVKSEEANKPVQTWYYTGGVNGNGLVKPDEVTNQIFDYVIINADMSNEDFELLNTTLAGFNIYVEGAAVQASVFEDAAASSNDLYGLLNPVG